MAVSGRYWRFRATDDAWYTGYGVGSFNIKDIGLFYNADLTSQISASSASASSQYSASYGPDKAIDGDLDTSWYSANSNDYQWLQVDCGSAVAVGSARLRFRYNGVHPKEFVVETSNTDGSGYTLIATCSPPDADGVDFWFDIENLQDLTPNPGPSGGVMMGGYSL